MDSWSCSHPLQISSPWLPMMHVKEEPALPLPFCHLWKLTLSSLKMVALHSEYSRGLECKVCWYSHTYLLSTLSSGHHVLPRSTATTDPVCIQVILLLNCACMHARVCACVCVYACVCMYACVHVSALQPSMVFMNPLKNGKNSKSYKPKTAFGDGPVVCIRRCRVFLWL